MQNEAMPVSYTHLEDLSVYATLSITSWTDVGAAQDEAALRSRVVDEATGLKALSGSGSKEYPYVLSSPEALAWFANKANTLHAAAITNTKRCV